MYCTLKSEREKYEKIEKNDRKNVNTQKTLDKLYKTSPKGGQSDRFMETLPKIRFKSQNKASPKRRSK